MRIIRLSELDGTVHSEWTITCISNYSEWVIPEVEWASNDTVFLRAPEKGGQLDELQLTISSYSGNRKDVKKL